MPKNEHMENIWEDTASKQDGETMDVIWKESALMSSISKVFNVMMIPRKWDGKYKEEILRKKSKKERSLFGN